ncbi:unnamed protein product [Adineta ricciae]|uniref:Derlin n=1 Tax=Adineta ricciae TaxID=249248 RepID=A0A814J732_ADIRI|nr:unnamed protein product [Adineta ricciae]
MVMYIEKWFAELPRITTGFFFIYLTTGIIAAFWPSYAIEYYLVHHHKSFSVRLMSFLYFGECLSVGYWYEFILFLIYSKSLEEEYSYHYRRAYYFFCLLLGVVIILLLTMLKPLETYLLSESFVFYIVFLYNNSKNPNGTTVFLPVLWIDNKYMIIVLIFINALFRPFLWAEYLIGIVAGFLFMKLERKPFIRDSFGRI